MPRPSGERGVLASHGRPAGRLKAGAEGNRVYGMNYWVITSNEEAYGPYETEADALMFARINLGLEGWTISAT